MSQHRSRTSKERGPGRKSFHQASGKQQQAAQEAWRHAAWIVPVLVLTGVGVAVMAGRPARPPEAREASLPQQTAQAAQPAPEAKSNAPAMAPVAPAVSPVAPVSDQSNQTSTAAAARKSDEAAELAGKAGDLLAKGNAQEAVKVYEQALALTPKDEDLHYNAGLACVQSGDITNAERHYREALRLLPDYAEVHNNLGNLLMRSKRLEEAEKHLTEAVNLAPESARVQNSLGTLRQQQHRTNDALLCYQKAVQCDTNFWEGRFNLGKVYLLLGNREQGVAELRETLRLNPSFEPAQRALKKATEGAN